MTRRRLPLVAAGQPLPRPPANRSRPLPRASADRPPRILLIAHNHPSLHPGGTEIFAHELFGGLKAAGAECLFLACTNDTHRAPRPGTGFQTLGRSADEVLLWAGHFDHFHQSQIDLHGLVPDLSNLLRAFRPDIVHVHHTLLLGVEMLFLIRRVCPDAKIVYTLHDYYPICANDGQMVTAADRALCEKASPDACHRCFPERPADQFLLREKHIKAMFGLVDRFLAPSRFLRDRYVAWGLDADRIEVMGNSRPVVEPAPSRETADGGRRDAFAYFGNLNPFKGVTVALEAVASMARQGLAPSLAVHGGSLYQGQEFRGRLSDAFEAARGLATPRGPYRREEMPALMAAADWVVMPSVWWENAPLVIQEAFQHRRPVICSGIGGMAEAVRDGVDGLHVRPNDPADLARVMTRAMTEPGLWERLSANIPAVRPTEEAALLHLALYGELLASIPATLTQGSR
ncbi:glycosyltransferase family 4 protein [Azospirillum picis]|uniref:Glycosyltransferase involved in cell wall biosynthesis n=1 Tax=Azospirillum picis TaxID=488438 RepID=A0ABU0MH57_9PROT|nr:glycosyltransferase family 4 protein [Azospirillum picis]MBP2298996.1 glycosyltransferase involved in cell wall biosynthesis [Azospirillum picis]MDQ0532762.1 glycosyltransferase involved in cell wall biosynthesis [Azospirillum picis]